MYKYETHLHTNLVSHCSKFEIDEIIDVYVKNGYTGIFVTDHFLNGNCHPEIRDPNLSYEEKIDLYTKGYYAVKERAKGKLDVFFGIEYSYYGTDVLVYGFLPEDLRKMPEIMNMTTTEFVAYMNAKGYLTVQAHPYREANYIDHIRIFPGVLAIETYNACRDDRTNLLADNFANIYPKHKTSGSDIHIKSIEYLGGMEFETKLISEMDFANRIKNDEGALIIKYKNKYIE